MIFFNWQLPIANCQLAIQKGSMKYLILIALILGLLSPVFRAVQHICLFRLPQSVFLHWPDWFYEFLRRRGEGGIGDGFHLFGGLNDLAARYGGIAFGLLLYLQWREWYWLLLAELGWFVYYYFFFNLYFHRWFMQHPDRTVWQCVPLLNWFFLRGEDGRRRPGAHQRDLEQFLE